MEPVSQQPSLTGNPIAPSYREENPADPGPVTSSLVRTLGKDSLLNSLVIKLVKRPYDAP